jgi:PIN domain nuclease of toxin-antitoxin system
VRLLLDTHALLWWMSGDSALSAAAHAEILDTGNDKIVSAASAWEIAIKFKLGKLPGAAPLVSDFDGALATQGFTALPISTGHGIAAGALPLLHRDPFDRMLVAQALAEHLILISNEVIFDAYGVARCW